MARPPGGSAAAAAAKAIRVQRAVQKAQAKLAAQQASAAGGASAPHPPPEVADDLLNEEVGDTESVFTNHEASITLGNPHPADVSESALLASAALPQLSYPHEAFNGRIIDETLLSSLQLESVLFAAQRHLRILPGGQRAGFFIGDGAGVGKGRQISGIILDAISRGQPRHIWFSIAPDLRVDAERDLKDIGCHTNVIDGCKALDAASSKGLGPSAESKRGVLFTTYTTLAMASGRGGKNRLQQLVAWCGGPSFEGCIVFDEAHRAKNFSHKKEEASTKVSQAVLALQDALPRARVVYCSATGVTDVSNLAYCGRLGLWGPQTAFQNFGSFVESLERRGLGALEMLATELKSAGAYVSRGLSWNGAEFEQVDCALSPEFRQMYDGAAAFWGHLRAALEFASGLTGASGACRTKECANGHVCSPLRMFWSAQQRFFREMITAFKVPAAVEQAKEALAKGQCVVVGLQSTGEAGLAKHMEDTKRRPGDVAKGLVCASRYSVERFIKEYFPTQTKPTESYVPSMEQLEAQLGHRATAATEAGMQWDSAQREKVWMELLANRASAEALAAEARISRLVPECVVEKEKCLERLKDLQLPPSPLDTLIDQLGGPDQVAEMTGRTHRVVRSSRSGKLQYHARVSGSGAAAESSINIQEREKFMAAEKRVAIISDAASTGISLHAAVGCKSQDLRRIHICLELAWSSDKTVQQLGRSHRSHQASAPIYRLLMTDVGGERRFAAAVSKRLQSLGALTKGDRRAATGGDMFGAFDLDNKLGRTALRQVYAAIESCSGLPKGVTVDALWEALHPSPPAAAAPAPAAAAGAAAAAAAAAAAPGSPAAAAAVAGVAKAAAAVAVTPGSPSYGDAMAAAAAKMAAVADKAGAESDAMAVDDESEGEEGGGGGGSGAAASDSPAAAAGSSLWGASSGADGAVDYDLASDDGEDEAEAADAAEFDAAADLASPVATTYGAGAPMGNGAAAAASGVDAAARMQEVLAVAAAAVDSMKVAPKDYGDVKIFLNRLLGQPVRTQNMLFTCFLSCLSSMVREARAAGTYDEGVADLVATSVTADGDPEVVARDAGTGVETILTAVTLDRGVSWELALAKRDQGLEALGAAGQTSGTGFYKSRNVIAGKTLYLLAVARANESSLFVVTRPSTGTSPSEMHRMDLQDKYVCVSEAAVQHAWEAVYHDTDNAERGSRMVRMGLLSGAVLPIWSALEATVSQRSASLTHAERALKVYRVCLDDGRKLVGVRLPFGMSEDLRANVAKLQAERANAGAAGALIVEPVAPLDAKTLRQLQTAPKTILSFFGSKAGGGGGGGAASSGGGGGGGGGGGASSSGSGGGGAAGAKGAQSKKKGNNGKGPVGSGMSSGFFKPKAAPVAAAAAVPVAVTPAAGKRAAGGSAGAAASAEKKARVLDDDVVVIEVD